jgi:ferredoxin
VIYLYLIDGIRIEMKIDKDLCDVCGTCASVCPEAAITIKEFEVEIDCDKCVDCKKCIRVCPPQAITESSSIPLLRRG